MDWQRKARFGCWRVIGPLQPPGWLFQDALTGSRHYVAAAPEQMAGVGEGSVLAGLIVPFDGIWRTGAVLFGLQDDQTRALVAATRALALDLVADLSGGRDPAGEALGARLRALGDTETPDPPVGGALAEILHRALAIGLPMFLRLVTRPGPPIMLTNSDGEPFEFISAEIAVAHMPDLVARFASHPDFHAEDDGAYVWEGRDLSPDEIAESRKAMRKAGIVPEGDDRPRWIRGRLEVYDRHLVAEVNSREWLAALLEVLAAMDARPVVVSEHVTQVPGVAPAPADEAASIASKFSTEPLKPVPVPAREALVAAAAGSRILRNIGLLLDLLGDKGVKLTQEGNLTRDHGRALAAAMGVEFDTTIRDKVFRTTSSGDVHDIALALRWARAGGLVKVVTGWAKPTKKAARWGSEPLDDWWMLFVAFVRSVDWPVRRWPKDRRPWWGPDISAAIPLILEEIARAGEEPLPLASIGERIRDGLAVFYKMSHPNVAESLAADVAHGVVRPLAALGALEATEEPLYPGCDYTTISAAKATLVGHWAIRRLREPTA